MYLYAFLMPEEQSAAVSVLKTASLTLSSFSCHSLRFNAIQVHDAPLTVSNRG